MGVTRMVPFKRRIIMCFIVAISFVEARQADKFFCHTDPSSISGKKSCASLLWDNHTDADCYMWFPGKESEKVSPKKDSAECDLVSFKPDEKSQIADLGGVKLHAFYEHAQTGINVTFSNIKWTSMFTRFKKDVYNRENFCREFTLSSKPVPPEKILFYDCLWSSSDMSDEVYYFEFKANDISTSSIGRYQFKTPNQENIKPSNKKLKESELFMYMDLTHLPFSVTLHLQTAKERFDIGSESYVVTMHYTAFGYETPTILEPELTEEDQITYYFQTNSGRGSYYFTAKINHTNCTKELDCYVSKSPTIVIKGSAYREVVLIAIAGCGAVVLSILSFAYFLWRIRNNSLNAPRPTVLLVYSPTSEKHTCAVVEFARFLMKFCHVEALVDELGIPMTNSKDPFTWCTDSFSKASAIMVVAPPLVACPHYERIYRNIDALSLRLLREKMADKELEMKYLTVVLPYCKSNEAGLPDEAKHLRRFYLPSNLDKMLTYLHTGSSTCHRKFCISPLIDAGLTEIKSNESDFVKAVKAAEEEVRVGSEKCGQCSGASTDHEGGPLLALRFTSIEVPGESYDDRLTWAKINHAPLSKDEMFPGPIENLNLLGSEGMALIDNSTARKVVSSGLNLNELDLG